MITNILEYPDEIIHIHMLTKIMYLISLVLMFKIQKYICKKLHIKAQSSCLEYFTSFGYKLNDTTTIDTLS